MKRISKKTYKKIKDWNDRYIYYVDNIDRLLPADNGIMSKEEFVGIMNDRIEINNYLLDRVYIKNGRYYAEKENKEMLEYIEKILLEDERLLELLKKE